MLEIDFIFVYGLGGNFRKIWSKLFLQFYFWLEEWLFMDFVFNNVCIYSYGYDLYYLKGQEDWWNIYYIGKLFFGVISILLCIVNLGIYIVVIGYSMGGLVMKKVYIMVK